VLNVGVDDKKAGQEPVEERSTQAPLPGLAAIQPRPATVRGATHRIETPLGKAYVTVNMDDAGNPIEAFVNIGSSGSDVMAFAEALGRLISLVLRTPSPLTPREKLVQIADQLSGIGGSRSVGFGAFRVLSLPDALSRVLTEYTQNLEEQVQQTGTLPALTIKGAICPSCGWASLAHEEGCKKCHSCGYSEC
jgi:ribonucleoside-diphosphate reductase alpha chain